ncbi:T9SS sorting signal type C domain-containing protein [Flavobacterium hibisci]|uniref:T9SS sorting signal type C domain-containing protein n=1 Tax=Flavobacterium hibisci TaxID=1914462 RepID=UPI001CBBB60E|nr:T9SS sorting signal type C domain-containing protein [Flavobacterium hibisci]MBZ4043334.1 T9SS sorting signal type C domain-containing protein [Flavobacterium hibisci]
MKRILLILLMGLFQNFIFGATITSTGAGGNWNSGSSWIGGVIPGASDDVVIVSGSTITVNTNVSAKSITVSGTMAIPANTDVSINSLLIIVKSPSGNIYFNKKSIITLPQNVALYLQNGSNSLNTSDSGVCSNNTEIHVGTTNYAVCTGGGATYTFDQVESAGGINTTITLSGNQYICTYGTNTTTFTSTVSSGTWSSGNTSVATVNPSTGVVTAQGVGTATITYTVSGVGSATRDVYVANGPGGGVSAINGSNSQCQNTSANYTVTSNSANYNHTWSYSGTGVTFVTSADGRSATATFASNATSGQIVVNSTNACGSGYGAGFNVTIAGVPSAPGTANPDSPLCTSFNAQWAFTSLATKYFIDVATSSSFGAGTLLPSYTNLDVGNVLVYPITGLNPGTTYYYRVRAYGNCGTSTNSSVMTYATTPSPVVPVATSISSNVQCNYAEPQWNTVANATGYYLDIATDSGFTNFVAGYNGFNVTGNNGIGPSNNLPAGTLYYRVRAYNNCIVTGNSNVVSFQTTAPVGGSVSPAQTICAGNSPTSNLTLSGYTTTNTAIVKWQKASDIGFTSNVSDISETTNVLSIAKIGVLTTSTYFRAVVQNQFGSWCMSNSTPVLITVNNSISAASSTPTVCINTALTPITHTVIGFTGIGTVTGLPSGVSPSLSGNTLTISGTPTASGTFNYTIPLTGGSCGGTRNATGTITVTAVPATPGTISQPTNKCASTTGNTFSITSVPGATSYTWSVTGTGWAVTAGGTTTSATITIGSGAGIVSVTATNACGTSSASTTGSVAPTTAPATPGTITQPTNTCAGSTGNTYSIASVSGATSYTWSVTGTGWAVTAGGTTTSATITIGSGAGTVSVTATNACGTSSASTTGSVAPTTAPATPGTITQPTNKCAGSTGNIFSIASVTGATSYTWSVTGTGWSVTSGGTTNSATITIGSGIGTVSVTATNACGTSSASTTGNITPTTAPATPGTITQPTNKCAGSNGNIYSIASVNGATSYTWSVTGSGWSVTSGGTTTSATITIGSGIGTVSVTATNACGTSSASTTGNITPNPSPTPTFTTLAQLQTCAGEHMTYTTQSGQSNYTWTVSGVLNTDYRLIARGTTTNYDIVIEWLTAGSKTVTVNYNNSNGCNGAAAATYATNVTVIDRGRVNGGAHICKGSTLPTLTLRNDAGNAPYPDASLVLMWQYSDDLNNATWNDIPGTAGQISYTPTAFPGAFRTYQVILKSGICTKTSIESRINIDAFNAPTLGTTTYPTCSVATGSVVLTGLPSGNWTINQTGTTTATYTNIVANTTSYPVVGLPAGTYTFTVKEGNCTSDASAILNMTQVANIWDGTKWSKTGDTTLPTAGDKIVFEGDYTVTSDISGCSCTVNSGNVIVNSGRTLTIKNEVTVNGGTLTFENNASLLQDVNTTVNNNSGPIIYKRNSQPMKNFDFTYWSSPVEGQTLYNLSPNTLWDKYQSYSGSGWKIETSTNVMQPGIGYIIRVPKPFAWPDPNAASYIQPVQFIGKPNNGNITSSQHMDKGKYYLIGNPYPSAIHADDFLFSNVNNRNILGGTIYFWTHNTAIKVVNSKLAYVSDDYASYNLTGGVATSAVSDPGYNDNPSLDTGRKPTGYIAAGQSFFTMAEDGSGYVEFNNSMRYGGTDNSQFFKPGKTSKSASIEKHRLWLNLTNTGGAFKQTLIGYVDGATNGYDTNFDGMTYDGNSYIDFYSVNETSRLTIQGRALPFSDSDVVPLGYRSTIAGDFTISIDQADGSLSTQRIYLEDKQTGTINELTAKNYTFTTKAGAFNNRFVLRYKNTTLGTGDFETVDDAVWVVAQNKTITVNSTAENIDKVFIYDVSGKELYSKDKVGNLELVLQNQPFAQQVLLVKVVLGNGYQTTKKVIFK